MGKTKRKDEEKNEGMKADRQAGTRARGSAPLLQSVQATHAAKCRGREGEKKGRRERVERSVLYAF